jgi:hypothetical protein
MTTRDKRAEMFERARAAKALISTVRNQDKADEMELAAFMAIFHPEKVKPK